MGVKSKYKVKLDNYRSNNRFPVFYERIFKGKLKPFDLDSG